jgi:hypothetical protein
VLLKSLLGTPYREEPMNARDDDLTAEAAEVTAMLGRLREDSESADALLSLLTPPSYTVQDLEACGLVKASAEDLHARFGCLAVELPELPGGEGRQSVRQFLTDFVNSLREALGGTQISV